MHSEPVVSVIMNCYNSGKYLREAIDSVYAQSYKKWEIIFWDNASTDNSAEIARSYDDKLRYFCGDTTVPLGIARSRAIAKASGELVAFLDCDDIWLRHKLERQVPLFSDPKVGIVYSNYETFSGLTGKTRKQYGDTGMPAGYLFEELLGNYFLGMLTVVIRRKGLDGLNEWFDQRFQICEEADLFIRLAHDWNLAYCNEILARYRIHDQNLTWAKPELFFHEQELMARKYDDLYREEIIRNPHLLHGLQRTVVFGRAVTALKEGRRKDARQLALPCLRYHPKFILVFFFSFLSYKCLKIFLRVVGKHLAIV